MARYTQDCDVEQEGRVNKRAGVLFTPESALSIYWSALDGEQSQSSTVVISLEVSFSAPFNSNVSEGDW